MVQLILYDFLPSPPTTTTTTTRSNKNDHDEYTHSDSDNLSNLLKNIWKQASERFLHDYEKSYEFLKSFRKHTYKKLPRYYTIPKEYVDNELVAWHMLRFIRCENTFLQISERLRNSIRIAIRAVSQFGYFYVHLSDELKKDKRVCLKAVTSCPRCYKLFSDEMKNDRDIVMRVLKSVSSYFHNFEFKLPEIYLNDKQVVELYVKIRELKILYYKLPKEMLDDRQIALSACISSPNNVGYISERLQHDFSFVKEVVRRNYFAYSELPKVMRENRELVYQLVGMNLPLFLVPYEFRKDEEIVKRCIQKTKYIYEIPFWFREDEEIFKMSLVKAYQVCKENLSLEKFIAPKYLNNRKYMNDLLKEIPELATNKYYNFIY
ncbi:predicted protein [Naegleria gruberi]|uniref:Predicted protein n=1 Tax=Naegleria gruberi TaxID=5762 RepID=D2VEA0_NAEGR|nr:uncharacterized protein NAEGRDRAFT_67203 [Naegleria gruberi]EFC44845.1 predicted protein [Naegleria gruberi]|eukprot:XP_002677589.1 predicted protein [Naegleria gruberi strain NEG-M]